MLEPWTAQEDGLIRDGLVAGHSASDIAAALKTRSRSAVLGRIHRIRRRDGEAPTLPAGRRGGKPHGGTARANQPPKPPAPRPGGAAVSRPIEIAVAPPPAEPMTFLAAATAGRCLFFACEPMAPDGPDMPVCGAERAPGIRTRYCAHHIVVQGGGKLSGEGWKRVSARVGR